MPEWTRNKPNFLYILQHKYCQLIFLFLNSMPNTKSTIGKLLHGPPLTINLICLRGSVIFLGLKHYFLLLSSYSQTRAKIYHWLRKYFHWKIFSGWRKEGWNSICYHKTWHNINNITLVQWVFLACVKYRIFG